MLLREHGCMNAKANTDSLVAQPVPAGDRLLLIDGTNVVRRVYEANPVDDIVERVAAAMRSAKGSFRRAMKEIAPTHVLAVFDFGGLTWRHQMLASYRQGRNPMPEELRVAMLDLYDGLEGELGIRCMSLPNVEADDVIAAAARRWMAQAHGTCVVLSTDKDMLQLLVHGVHVRDHFGHAWRNEEYVAGKYGVSSQLFGDFLALTGDSADGIPGIHGIGRKTAAKLLTQYGSMNACLAAASCGMKGHVGELLRNGEKLARLSRELIEFKTDMRLGICWNDLKVAPAA